ncbi:hypothetical protein ACFE04_029212 [Oxalis oulophora]
MGTPEFPNLGKHCSVDDCRQIDFLPFTCDRCQQKNVFYFGGFNLARRFYFLATITIISVGPLVMLFLYFELIFCRNDVTVVICPLCAKGVRLNPEVDPNISWDRHANTECDPSNYDKVTKKRRCPVPRCKEVLTFSNTIKCKDCLVEHCLKHRFAIDHKCPGPKKPESAFSFMSNLNRSSRKEEATSNWSSFFDVANSVRASAEASMSKLSTELSQKWQVARDGLGLESNGVEQCPQCSTKFSKGFRDPADLVQHVEQDHGGTSRV